MSAHLENHDWSRWISGKRRDYEFFCDLDRLERIEMVRRGVPANVLVRLATDMRVPREELLDWLGIARWSANRKLRKNAVLSLGESERALGIARIIGLVARVVSESGEPAGFDPARWLGAWSRDPNLALGGRRPGDYMDTTDGRELVSSLISQMQSGAYA